MKRFDEVIDPIINDLQELRWKNDNIPNDMPLRDLLAYYAMSEEDTKQVLKMINGLNIIKAQFREMMTTTSAMSGFWAKASLSASDVRRIMLGEEGLSGAIEAKALGFKPDDVNPATDDANIVNSKTLGAGNAGTAFLLTSKAGEEFVFKPELDGRLGLNTVYVGMNGSYVNAQKTANLNFATQDTAKIFKCENLVVKYSVGTHKGQFGIFMEKAKGFTGEDLYNRRIKNDKDCDISPSVMRETVTDKEARNKIEAQLAQKFNKLQWLDIITGQQDRHWSNYFINIDKTTHEVTLKAIDNDASFSAKQIGMNKFALDKDAAKKFDTRLKNICFDLYGKDGWEDEYDNRVSKDRAIVRNQDGSITIDLSKATSTEVKMAVIGAIGMQSPGVVAPEEIDEEFYNVLMEMDGKDSAKRKEYLDSIAPRISPAALKAADEYLKKAWQRFSEFAEAVIKDPAQGPFALEAYLDAPDGPISFMNEILFSWNNQYTKTRNQSIQQGEEMCANSWGSFRNPPIMGKKGALEQYDHAIKTLYTYVNNCEFLEKHVAALEKLILRVKEYLRDGLKPLCASILFLQGEFGKQDQSDQNDCRC